MAHITLTTAKGGCGKTTVALNLAVCFAKAGYRTLAIDLGQQGNLSAGLASISTVLEMANAAGPLADFRRSGSSVFCFRTTAWALVPPQDLTQQDRDYERVCRA